MLVSYVKVHGKRDSHMDIHTIGKTQETHYQIAALEGFLSDKNVQTRTVVITSDVTFVVSFYYYFYDPHSAPFTSSVLYPVGPESAHYFVLTSTAACSDIPTVENYTASNPIVSNANCLCQTFLLVVAVGIGEVTHVRFEFPPGTAFYFNAGDIEENGFPSQCTSSVQMMQAKPVSEGDTIFHTAPYNLPPPNGVTSLENYRVVALHDDTEVTISSSEGVELGKIVLNRAGEVREFSVPNTELYVIKSNLPVLVYRLSFAAPNKNTNLNDVIMPCLSTPFSLTHSLKNNVGHFFAAMNLDYIHLVVRIYLKYSKSSDLTGLRINDLPYNQSSYNPKEFSGPGVIMLRLDVSGLESIRIWKEGENGTMIPGALYAGHACAGVKGFSGFCSDLEARHSTKLRLSPPVDIADLVRRNFHETATPIVQYGFDVTEQPISPTTESPQSQNETERNLASLPNVTVSPQSSATNAPTNQYI
ncbi:hypothetical protein ElyMa_005439400 [Elysia marginata]|uniref:IgGFc-binding protein N-terminal domain-containing protein n=1 Tax=Elysia marginata TaxID=1093978 RepID=A0AAV4EM57_9GAST|nr:hypothetical protein ElyMa_005439400 [Elysia marginata]